MENIEKNQKLSHLINQDKQIIEAQKNGKCSWVGAFSSISDDLTHLTCRFSSRPERVVKNEFFILFQFINFRVHLEQVNSDIYMYHGKCKTGR